MPKRKRNSGGKKHVCPHCSTQCSTKPILTRHLKSNKRCLRSRGITESPLKGNAGYCVSCGCRASFGVEVSKPLHCREHKEANERDVVARRCKAHGCPVGPSFGTTDGKPLHCARHKEAQERNVVAIRCAISGCCTVPSFGIQYGKPLHCVEHKQANESDVRSRRCAVSGCSTHPSFGTQDRKPLHCAEHRQADERDVVSHCCTHPGCPTHPSFGTKEGTPLHCAEHKEPDERSVRSRPLCEIEGCFLHAVTQHFCKRHQPDYIAAIPKYSKISCQFMDQLQSELGFKDRIMHVHYNPIVNGVEGSEFKIPNTNYRADGFLEPGTLASLTGKIGNLLHGLELSHLNRRWILEFLGDLWHGNPARFHPDGFTYFGARYGDLYEDSMSRLREISELGYTVIYIWEADYKAWQKQVVRSLWSFCKVFPGC